MLDPTSAANLPPGAIEITFPPHVLVTILILFVALFWAITALVLSLADGNGRQ